MAHLFPTLLLTVLFLSSCDRIKKVAAIAAKDKPMSEKVRISSESKPEIIAAFEAISQAIDEHNRVFLDAVDSGKPVNELSYSAGLAHLDRSARQQTGVARQIINAVATTHTYEKSLFVPFDTMRRQMDGMPTWTKNAAIERRGYILIIDQEIATYDSAVSYLERGEEPLLRRNFQAQAVPPEVTEEFIRLKRLHGKVVEECTRGMFVEQRAALQSYREALASVDPAQANQHAAAAKQHEQLAKQFESRMIAAIRNQLGSAGNL